MYISYRLSRSSITGPCSTANKIPESRHWKHSAPCRGARKTHSDAWRNCHMVNRVPSLASLHPKIKVFVGISSCYSDYKCIAALRHSESGNLSLHLSFDVWHTRSEGRFGSLEAAPKRKPNAQERLGLSKTGWKFERESRGEGVTPRASEQKQHPISQCHKLSK